MKTRFIKSTLSSLLILLLVVSLTACGDKAEKEFTSLPEIDLDLPTSTSEVDDVYNPDGSLSTETTEPDTTTEPVETESETENNDDDSNNASAERKLALTTNQVNMRKSANGEVLQVLPKGALVTVKDTSDAEWYQIDFGGQDGFIASRYLDTNTTTTEMSLKAKVSAKTLNVRASASSDGEILGSLAENDEVTVIDAQSGWYKINYKDSTGFVSSAYLTFAD